MFELIKTHKITSFVKGGNNANIETQPEYFRLHLTHQRASPKIINEYIC